MKLNESLYQALDENGQSVATINEGIHRSVVTRYAANAQICSDDTKGSCTLATYKPENLSPYFTGTTFNGLPIVD